jgi:hypothetical protein
MDIPWASIMYWTQWTCSVTLTAFATICILGNYVCAVQSLLDGKHRSWVFFFGGPLGALGLAIAPSATLSAFWWVPLFLDIACAPFLVLIVIWALSLALRRIRTLYRHARGQQKEDNPSEVP